jgi:hypothetical protein
VCVWVGGEHIEAVNALSGWWVVVAVARRTHGVSGGEL